MKHSCWRILFGRSIIKMEDFQITLNEALFSGGIYWSYWINSRVCFSFSCRWLHLSTLGGLLVGAAFKVSLYWALFLCQEACYLPQDCNFSWSSFRPFPSSPVWGSLWAVLAAGRPLPKSSFDHDKCCWCVELHLGKLSFFNKESLLPVEGIKLVTSSVQMVVEIFMPT